MQSRFQTFTRWVWRPIVTIHRLMTNIYSVSDPVGTGAQCKWVPVPSGNSQHLSPIVLCHDDACPKLQWIVITAHYGNLSANYTLWHCIRLISHQSHKLIDHSPWTSREFNHQWLGSVSVDSMDTIIVALHWVWTNIMSCNVYILYVLPYCSWDLIGPESWYELVHTSWWIIETHHLSQLITQWYNSMHSVLTNYCNCAPTILLLLGVLSSDKGRGHGGMDYL